MASLQYLLVQEGFGHGKSSKCLNKVKFRDRTALDDSMTLPISICRELKTFELSRPKIEKVFLQKGSSVVSSRKDGSESGKLNARSSRRGVPERGEPPIDDVATGAVISILSGYVGQYSRDDNFRRAIRDKCYSCFLKKGNECDKGIRANLELGIASTEKLVDSQGAKKHLKMKTLQNAIRLLSIVAALNAKSSKNCSTNGTPNSSLSACAQLYLSIVYKFEKNDLISARHLLQVFVDSPFLARTHLLPELWEHFFLPHLLHLKVWHSQELDFLSNSDYFDKEKMMKTLSMVYNEHMDMGTTQFALYYKQWLKAGVHAPSIPSVPLPSRPNYAHSRRRSSDSYATDSSIKKSLYRSVFGPSNQHRSFDFDERTGESVRTWCTEDAENLHIEDSNNRRHSPFNVSRTGDPQRSSSQICRKSKPELWPEDKKSDYFRILTCSSEPAECLVQSNRAIRNHSVKVAVDSHLIPSSDLSGAITTICSSDSLNDCEMAIRLITKAWLDSHGDHMVEATLSRTPVIEGMLEVLFASNDDEVLELAISILAELVTRKEIIGHIILNSDPQLYIFLRLLRSSSLFLKAAALLFLVKPKAKQMISIEWVPLVLRVLEFGDQLQMLLTVQSTPQVAAYYFLELLLNGFDEDKNFENAREVVSLGGLSLLTRRIEVGDITEKNKAANIIYYCVQADGSCRHYLANNLNKGSILSLIALAKQIDYCRHAFMLLTELLCLNRRTQRTKFLNELVSGWGSFNTMHILLVYLHKVWPEERPMVAALMLQLDLLGDPLKCSVYREEAVEAITAALDCRAFNEKVQEQSAKALLILGGHFSYTGEPATEKWLLKEAGFDESSGDSYRGRDFVADRFAHLNDDENVETENWQRKAALVLLNSASNRLLAALSDAIANGIPCLARASLVTVSWISIHLHSIADDNLQSEACLILVPQLTTSLNYDNTVEERVLASFSLLSLLKASEYASKVLPVNKGLIGHLRDLSNVTWTASELISIISSKSISSSRRHSQSDSTHS